MPELPEVETVLRGLEDVLVGRRFVGVDLFRKNLRTVFPSHFERDVRGQSVVNFTRRAKYMLLALSNNKTLIIHLGMSGSFVTHIGKNQTDITRDKHDHVGFYLDDGTLIFYRDPRRFGVMDIVPTSLLNEHPLLAHLGMEPLDRGFSGAALFNALRTRSIPIKQAIMDQKIVVGVGNIYASESLFASGIHPERSAQDVTRDECDVLVKHIKSILKKAISAGGSTLRNYRQVGGEAGCFQMRFAVYDREGDACKGCNCALNKTGGIKRIVQGGRSTFYCPQKQI